MNKFYNLLALAMQPKFSLNNTGMSNYKSPCWDVKYSLMNKKLALGGELCRNIYLNQVIIEV